MRTNQCVKCIHRWFSVSKIIHCWWNDASTLKIQVGLVTNEAMLLVDVVMVDWITLVIWFDIQGGKIPCVTIVEVGVVWALELDTGGVSSILTQWRGILLARFDLRAGTCTTHNGKFLGNGGLKCGVNSLAPRSSTITSSGFEALNYGGLLSMILVWPTGRKVLDGSSWCHCGGRGELFLISSLGGRPWIILNI